MTSRIPLGSLAVVTLVAAASHAASAQAANSSVPASPASVAPATIAKPSAPSGSTTMWDARPSGKYLLELTLPDRTMEATLTISDSAGTPVALFWPNGDNDGHALSVTVDGADLKLYAATPRGPFNMTLNRAADHITGRFSMGVEESGPVEGHFERSGAPP
ncbi:MAG: hypothetical protein ACJ79K_13505 [Gemmatimonadaceae bacterium]